MCSEENSRGRHTLLVCVLQGSKYKHTDCRRLIMEVQHRGNSHKNLYIATMAFLPLHRRSSMVNSAMLCAEGGIGI